MDAGLTNKEAQLKLKNGEYNELPNTETKTVLEIALSVFKEPMFMLLLACGILYITLGDYREGIILFQVFLSSFSSHFTSVKKPRRR